MVREETGLSAKIAREVIEQLESTKKEKEFKMKLSKGKKKKNFVMVIILKTNGNVDIKKIQIKEDLIYLKESDTFHSATTDYIGYYKGTPVMILPEWDLKPLHRRELLDKAGGGRYAKPQTVIIHNIERAAGLLKHKKQFGGSLIWIILGGAVVVYLVYTALTGQ